LITLTAIRPDFGFANRREVSLLEAKDMHRTPPTTEPLSRNFLDETVFWIIAAAQTREAMRTNTSPATRHGRSSNTQFRARGFGESIHHALIRIVSMETG
jgi:hypothetical protein